MRKERLRRLSGVLLALGALVLAWFGFAPPLTWAHSYIFSKKYEEMRDQVAIFIMPGSITIQYNSKYYGQIAPHIRNMMDTNGDTVVSRGELEAFLTEYRRELNQLLRRHPVFVDSATYVMQLADVEAPGVLTDSLLAPLKWKMVFEIQGVRLDCGRHKLEIPPGVLFLNGTHLIDMARERVAFTADQERAIGRFLLVTVLGSDEVTFLDAYPGFVRRSGDLARIYGVFYDKSVLKLGPDRAPALRVTFVRKEAGSPAGGCQ